MTLDELLAWRLRAKRNIDDMSSASHVHESAAARADEAYARMERLEAVRYLIARHGAKVIAALVRNLAAEMGEAI